MFGKKTYPKIYEDNYEQQQFNSARANINNPEQIKRAEFYINKYNEHVSDLGEYKEEWEQIEKMYRCERDIIDPSGPNSFVPVLLPNVEGQVAAMTANSISANIKGKGFSDQSFAHTGQIITDFFLKENKINQRVKEAARRYLKFGNCVFSFAWNPEAFNQFGLPEWRCPSITKVFIDGNIKSILDIQKAEYIIEEVGNKSILWAKKEYGEEKASAIALGNNQPDFNGKESGDDEDSFTLLYVWTRNNDEGNLQRLEISKCGILLRESDSSEPYYKYVGNKYPFTFARQYQCEGEFYGFGDGKMLAKVQDLMNKLYDEVIIACKFNSQARTFIDPSADCDTDQFDNDPSHPIVANKPRENVHTVLGGGVNQVVFMLIQNLMTEVQKMTRFSSLMTGNGTGNRLTATQAGIQLQQGSTGIDDKRSDISDAIADGVEYCLGLCMEFWSAAQALRISEDKDEFEWVDARQLANVPVMVPTDSAYEKKWEAENPITDMSTKPVKPKFMQLTSNDGNGQVISQTKQVAFDTTVSIGEGLPTNKIALYNIILQLAQLQLIDETTGQPRPLLSFQQVQKMVQDLLGIPIETAMDQARKAQEQNPQAFASMNNMPKQPPLNVNATVPGANMSGSNIGGGVGAL